MIIVIITLHVTMNVNKKDPKMHPVGRSVACYFCNEFFDDIYLNNHIIQCGAVLEPCPKNCGVYIPRHSKEKHVVECRYRKSRPKSFSDNVQATASNTVQKPIPVNIEHLENEIISLRSTVLEERRNRQELQVELHRIQRLYQQSEEYNKKLNVVLDNLKHSWFAESEKRKNFIAQTKLELDKIYLQYQVMENWKRQIDTGIEHVKKTLTETENKILDTEFSLKKHDDRLGLLDTLEIEMNMLHQKIRDDQFNRQEEAASWRGELNEFKEFFSQENAMISALWSEQRDETEELKKALELQISVMNDFKTKYHSLIFDTKSISQTAIETNEKLDSQTKNSKAMKDKLEQLKLDFESLELSITNNNSLNALQTGRLLWKISDFESKMEHAKEHNTCLFSPIFNSSLYGYKLRLEVYLNGIKKWRGRHIILSMQVLKGEWDSLLIWPCRIEAKVTLKDQSSSQKRDFIKYISAKRSHGNDENEEPQESSSQYIFISHATVEKQTFIRDNTLFFEIYVVSDNLPTEKKFDMTTL